MTTLENAVIAELAKRADIVSEFPFFKQGAAPVTACCGRKSNYDFNMVKSAIAGLTHERQQKFKQLLGVSTVRVVYRQGDQIVPKTF